MFKSLARNVANWMMGAVIFSAVGAAFAVTGQPPLTGIGPNMPDGVWLNGVAAGLNFTYQSGLTAVGSTQATALQLGSGIYLFEVDTSGSGGATGIALPECVAGAVVNLLNNTAYTIDVYPAVANNSALATPAQDVIVVAGSAGTTSTSQTLYSGKTYTCAKTGTWLAK